LDNATQVLKDSQRVEQEIKFEQHPRELLGAENRSKM